MVGVLEAEELRHTKETLEFVLSVLTGKPKASISAEDVLLARCCQLAGLGVAFFSMLCYVISLFSRSGPLLGSLESRLHSG